MQIHGFAVEILGNTVIRENDIINILAFVFLALGVVQESIKIVKYMKMQVIKTEKKKTAFGSSIKTSLYEI